MPHYPRRGAKGINSCSSKETDNRRRCLRDVCVWHAVQLTDRLCPTP